MIMHGNEKSDEGVLPEKRSNKGGLPLAEAVEGRTSPKGNSRQTAVVRTRSRAAASNGLAAVRQAARQSKEVRFTALLYHITVELLERSYFALKRNSAPGIDGVTWQAYGATLEEKLTLSEAPSLRLPPGKRFASLKESVLRAPTPRVSGARQVGRTRAGSVPRDRGFRHAARTGDARKQPGPRAPSRTAEARTARARARCRRGSRLPEGT